MDILTLAESQYCTSPYPEVRESTQEVLELVIAKAKRVF